MKVLKIGFLVIFISVGCLLSGCGRAMMHMYQGDKYWGQGKYEEAIAKYQKVIEVDPDNWGAEAYISIGNVYSLQGKYEDAIAAFQQAIEIDSNSDSAALAHHRQGFVYRKQGKYENAIAEYQKAIAIDLDRPWSYDALGNIYHQQGKLEDAIAAYQKIIEITPYFAMDANFDLGLIYRQQGKLDDAIDTFQQIIQNEIEIAPNRKQIHLYQGMIYLTQDKLDEALAEFQKVVNVNPKEGYAHYSLACIYSLKNQPQLAIESLQKAIDLDKSIIELFKTDPDFDNIRQTPEYQQLINSD